MPAPTERMLRRWWDAQPEGFYTCSDCGRVDLKTYVQPQHPFYAEGRDGVARCGQCLGRVNAEVRARRRAELAARPRDCERCAARPHTCRYGPFRLCGRCATRTRREQAEAMAQAGALAIFATGPMIDTSRWAAPRGRGHHDAT